MMINEREKSRQIRAQIFDCAITKKYVKKPRIFYEKGVEIIANTSESWKTQS